MGGRFAAQSRGRVSAQRSGWCWDGEAAGRRLSAGTAAAAKHPSTIDHTGLLSGMSQAYRYMYHVCKYHVDVRTTPRKLLEVQALQVVLGNRLRELRRKQGFSQESFADHCGLHRTYMGGIERGEHNLTIQTALTIARGLGITVSKLLSGIDRLVEAPADSSKP